MRLKKKKSLKKKVQGFAPGGAVEADDSGSYNFKRNKKWAKDGPYMTPLNKGDELAFKNWVKTNNVPFDPAEENPDYDMRGFWKAAQQGDPRANTAVDPNDGLIHYDDRWKTPYHDTFSNESQYAKPNAPAWNNTDQLIDSDGNIVFDDRKDPGMSESGYADGGAVEADDSDEEDDALPDESQPVSQEPAQQPEDQPQVISMDDARKLGYSDQDQPQVISMDDARKMGYREAEGMLATGGRRAAKGVLPAIAGTAAWGPGMAGGAAVGSLLGPVGTFVGGIAGGVLAAGGAGYVTGKAQEAALDATGLNNPEQEQANAEANPWSSAIGGALPGMAAMSPAGVVGGIGKQIATRTTGAVFTGTIDAAQQLALTGQLDPRELAVSTAAGAIAPRFNAAGEKLSGAWRRFLPKTGAAVTPQDTATPGAPGRERTSEGIQAVAEATASQPLDPSGRGGNYTPPHKAAASEPGDGFATRLGEFGTDGRKEENKSTAKVNVNEGVPDDIMAALGEDNEPEKISSAAIRVDGKIYTGQHHGEAAIKAEKDLGREIDSSIESDLSGFVTNKGRYVTREEAQKIVEDAGQAAPDQGRLLSEKVRQNYAPTKDNSTDTGIAEAFRARRNQGGPLGSTPDAFLTNDEIAAQKTPEQVQSAPVEPPKENPVTKFLGNEEGGVTLPTKEDLKKTFLRSRKEWDFRNRPAANKQEQQAYDIADRYQQMKQRKVNNGIQGEQDSVALDKVTTPEERQELFAARDKDAVAGNTKQFDALPDELKAKYDQYLAPLDAERNTLFDEVKAAAPDKVGRKIQNQVAHIRSDIGPLAEGGQAANPIDGTLASIGRAKGSAIDRTVVGLENTRTGKRDVIELNGEGKGFKLWRDGKAIENPDKNFEFAPGETYTIGKNTYKMGDATVAEKEAATPYKYHKDIAGSILNSRYQLANMKEELNLFKDITHSDAFHEVAQRKGGNQETPAGWRETKNPAFKGWEFDPYVAEALDDAASPGLIAPDSPWAMLRTANNAMLRTIFISPTAHILNVGAHWAIGRGSKWAPGPKNVRNFFETSAESVRSVLAQDDFQKQMRHEGAGTVYGGIIGNEREFTNAIAKTLGIAIDRQPARWEQIARDLHLGTPIDATKAIYNASQKAMWSVNDMFLTQAVKENMRNGMSMKDAIAKAEQHIPNYRVASRLIASNGFGRIVSQTIQEPAIVAFGRYKAGMLNSWAHMGRDLIQGDAARKKEAGAQFLVFGIMALVIWPLLNKLVQKVTGNKEAGFSARGPLSVPYALTHMGESGEPSNVTGSLLSLSPAINISKELLTGKDFAGRDIVGKQELHDALHGSLRAMGRVAVEGGGHFLNEAVAPLGTATTAYNKGQNPLQWAAGQALDIKTPSEAAQRYEQNAPKYRYQDFIKRQKRPQTPYEALYNKATGNQD